ncbi:hypothetical protein O181_028387 [Austropuccinia psidii MF-1]|uniref:adenosine kinase n=1 Tax=Austropuccinia psidii MF-1 TaxID=1389203 RepID=A0A9Q3CUG9_9BASI|nr:hypothetical protein [Austropuccinia psidii MF-1]
MKITFWNRIVQRFKGQTPCQQGRRASYKYLEVDHIGLGEKQGRSKNHQSTPASCDNMTSSPALLCMGNPLLDMQINTDEKFLEKYGLKPNDAILADASQKAIYAEVASLWPVYLAGGAAQNTGRFAQYVLPENSTVYLGAVGADQLADQLREANKKAGLKELYQIVKDFPTGACACLITGHNRSLCTQLGAAEKFSSSHLKTEAVVKAIEGAKFYYLGGFFLTHGIESALELAKAAVEKEKVFSLNLSAPFISQFFKDNVNQLLPYVDYVFGNESEAAAYATAHEWSTTDLATIAVRIASLPKKVQSRPRIVVITQGAQPTIVACTSTTVFSSPAITKSIESGHVLTVPVSPLKSEDIVDTNGAGDAFAGGAIAGLILGKALEESIEIGHKLGQMCIGQIGPQLKWPKSFNSSRVQHSQNFLPIKPHPLNVTWPCQRTASATNNRSNALGYCPKV